MDEQTNPCELWIVENDDEDRLLLSYELQDFGLEKDVRFFSGVQELVCFYNTGEQNSIPALILLNAFVPVIDLRNAVALIKSMQKFRTVPLVLMLGSQWEKEYLQPYNLDVSGYLKKPINGLVLKRFLKIR